MTLPEPRDEIQRIMDLPDDERQEALDRWAWRKVAQQSGRLDVDERRDA